MKAIRTLLPLFVLLISTVSFADDHEGDAAKKLEKKMDSLHPHQVVESVTVELMKVVNKGKKALDENPKQYFADVRGIMETAVDFRYIARNVMGAKHWTEASPGQQEKFVEVFTSGLVETYAKGMANFANFEISLEPMARELGSQRKAEVVQQFKGPNGVNKVSYTMGKSKSGEWKLINVVLDGVNLGKTLRAQFAQSVTENKGNLDSAISSWTWKS